MIGTCRLVGVIGVLPGERKMFRRQFTEGRRPRRGDGLCFAREPGQQLRGHAVGCRLLNERIERLASGGECEAIGLLVNDGLELGDAIGSLAIGRRRMRRQDRRRHAKAVHHRERRRYGDVQALATAAAPTAAASPARSGFAEASDDMGVRVDDRSLRVGEGGQCDARRR